MVTFASLITPAGVIIAAGIITGIVELLKNVWPVLYARVNGLQQAFILSAGLYVIAAVVLTPLAPDGYLGVFLAWLSCATSAVGIYEAGVKPALGRSVRKTTKTTRPIIGRDEKFDEP